MVIHGGRRYSAGGFYARVVWEGWKFPNCEHAENISTRPFDLLRRKKMKQFLKQALTVGVCLFALFSQANADSLSDAKRAYDSGNYAKAARLYKPLAQQGNSVAQFRLGKMYYYGNGVPQDYKEAAKWYLLSAKDGDAVRKQFWALCTIEAMVFLKIIKRP